MCDIDAATRRARYAELREHGYKRGFAQRARDFKPGTYKRAIKRDMLDVEICNICNDGQRWGKKQ